MSDFISKCLFTKPVAAPTDSIGIRYFGPVLSGSMTLSRRYYLEGIDILRHDAIVRAELIESGRR